MSKKSIQEEIKRKKRFVFFLRNSIFFLEDALAREDKDKIKEYQRTSIDIINAIIGINSHGELKTKDTQEEDAQLKKLKDAVRKLSEDIGDIYKSLRKSLHTQRGYPS